MNNILQNKNIIFKTIVGSQAYGTATVNSDLDVKGIYVQSLNEILGFNYIEQINVSKDETYYEVKRFLELLVQGNPTMLELLFMPENCIIEKKPIFDFILKHKDKFITKKCLESFGGYAISQIRKAKGLDKKMNWESFQMKRKSVLDFCYVLLPNGGSKLFNEWLNDDYNKKYRDDFSNFYPMPGSERTYADFGLAAIDHARDTYNLYDLSIEKYKEKISNCGIISDLIKSNNVQLTSIPKGIKPFGILIFNKDGFSSHCKKYKEWKNWLENRNIQRYVDNVNHNQKIDGKNLLHCRRLLDMALEIAKDKQVIVQRPNADYLLKIKRGEVSLNEIIEKAEEDILILNDLTKTCDLPDEINKEFLNDLLIKIRKKEYEQ